MKRPMLYWVILFVLGEILCRILSINVIGVAAVLAAWGCLVLAAAFFKEYRNILWIGCLFFLLGAVRLGYMDEQYLYCQMEEGSRVTFEGTVTRVETSGQKRYYILKSERIGEKTIRVGIRLSLDDDRSIELGSRLTGSGAVKTFGRASNPGGYDELSYQKGKGIFLSLQNIENLEQSPPTIHIREKLYRIRQHLSGIYNDLFGEKNGSLAAAMVLGSKEALDADIRQLYQQNGIAHLIAISGLHIAMIGGTLYQLLRKWSGSYPAAAGVGICFILLYGIMTGASGATVRAVIMLIVSMGADVNGRTYDTVTAVCIALFLMLVINPYQITQAGFLLSFGAVLGIACVVPLGKQMFLGMPGWLTGLNVSISVQLVILPVMLYFFYEVPVYGVLMNLIVIPLMSILLAGLLLCGLVGCVSLGTGFWLSKPVQMIFSFYEFLCHVSEKLPFHTVCTGRPPVLWILIYYGVLCLMLVAGYRKQYRQFVLFAILYLGTFLFFLLPGQFKICMFDVGQGDGIYMRTPDKKHILMDGGSSSKQKVGTYVLKNGIKFYGGQTLDYVFLSHSDSDHYSGIEELLEDETICIRTLILPAISNPDEAYIRIEQKAVQRGCKVYYMKRGDTLRIGDVFFHCVNPTARAYEDKNSGSLVFLVTYGAFDMLFTGDIDESVERELLEQDDFRKLTENMEVLKVAHHGSATASSEEFLKVVRPAAACISVAEQNHYGHPAKETVKRLEQFCGKIYLTKDSGAITINTDGTHYRISTFFTE